MTCVKIDAESKDRDQIAPEAQAQATPKEPFHILAYIRYIIGAVVVTLVATAVILGVTAVSHQVSITRREPTFILPFDGNTRQYEIIARSDWAAQPPLTQDNLTLPVDLVIITHTSTPFCNSFRECSKILRSAQKYDLEAGLPDIADNFLISGDGKIYEGRGWEWENSRRNESISVAFIGNFFYDRLRNGMVQALVDLLDEGVVFGKLSSDYRIVCQNQTSETSSPGEHVYSVVKASERFEEGKLY